MAEMDSSCPFPPGNNHQTIDGYLTALYEQYGTWRNVADAVRLPVSSVWKMAHSVMRAPNWLYDEAGIPRARRHRVALECSSESMAGLLVEVLNRTGLTRMELGDALALGEVKLVDVR